MIIMFKFMENCLSIKCSNSEFYCCRICDMHFASKGATDCSLRLLAKFAPQLAAGVERARVTYSPQVFGITTLGRPFVNEFAT
jgi:hypothetical protein